MKNKTKKYSSIATNKKGSMNGSRKRWNNIKPESTYEVIYQLGCDGLLGKMMVDNRYTLPSLTYGPKLGALRKF